MRDLRAALQGSTPWPEVKDQTDGPATLWPGCPVLGIARTRHPPGCPCSTFLSTETQTHARSTPRPRCTYTHMRTRVCMHKRITFPSPRRPLRPGRSVIPLSEHPSSPLASAERQQRRGRESAGPAPAALPAALPAARPARPPASAEKPEEPRRDRGRGPRATAATQLAGAAGMVPARARGRG